MTLNAPVLARTCRPGQFVNVRVGNALEPFFRRPLAIYRVMQSSVEILVEVRGRGTEILAQKKPGDVLDVLGPLGNGFTMPDAAVSNVVFIAGGVGVAPLLSLAEALKGSGKNLTLLYGGRNQDYVFDLSAFQEAGCTVHVATDDGSVGKKGCVSVLFDQISGHAQTTRIYTCGPNPMMKAVQAWAKEHCIAGQCSCEEVMACGIGACLGCIILTNDGYRTVCHDGPVFDLQEVIF